MKRRLFIIAALALCNRLIAQEPQRVTVYVKLDLGGVPKEDFDFVRKSFRSRMECTTTTIRAIDYSADWVKLDAFRIPGNAKIKIANYLSADTDFICQPADTTIRSLNSSFHITVRVLKRNYNPNVTPDTPGHGPSKSKTKIALCVSGSTHLSSDSIRYSIRDADSMADRLAKCGYRTQLLHDPPAANMQRAIKQFAGANNGKTILVFYYSGFVTVNNDSIYLVPHDVDLTSTNHLKKCINLSKRIYELDNKNVFFLIEGYKVTRDVKIKGPRIKQLIDNNLLLSLSELATTNLILNRTAGKTSPLTTQIVEHIMEPNLPSCYLMHDAMASYLITQERQQRLSGTAIDSPLFFMKNYTHVFYAGDAPGELDFPKKESGPQPVNPIYNRDTSIVVPPSPKHDSTPPIIEPPIPPPPPISDTESKKPETQDTAVVTGAGGLELFLSGRQYLERKNTGLALAYFRQSALRFGSPDAMIEIGDIYSSERPNFDTVLKYYLMAESKGSRQAAMKLGFLFCDREHFPGRIDRPKAIAYLQKAQPDFSTDLKLLTILRDLLIEEGYPRRIIKKTEAKILELSHK